MLRERGVPRELAGEAWVGAVPAAWIWQDEDAGARKSRAFRAGARVGRVRQDVREQRQAEERERVRAPALDLLGEARRAGAELGAAVISLVTAFRPYT